MRKTTWQFEKPDKLSTRVFITSFNQHALVPRNSCVGLPTLFFNKKEAKPDVAVAWLGY
jgi:hypothetical protein